MMTLPINRFYMACLWSIVHLALASCNKAGSDEFNMDGAVQISGFSINGEEGNIDQRTGEIVLSLPFGTDLTTLAPQFEISEGAKSIPATGEVFNFTGNVPYSVYNGNLYKDYTVRVLIAPPITAFTIGETVANIDHGNKNISLLLPDGTDVSALTVEMELAKGVTASPVKGAILDFTTPQTFNFRAGKQEVSYQVTAISNSIYEYAFIGTASSREAITNPDEKAAADWFFTTYPESDYLSFLSIASGLRLSNYKVLWWHYDTSLDLPSGVVDNSAVNALKAYREQGGGLLLTGFAALYLEALGIVPAGNGPNNVFGDFDGNGFVETGSDWGISFRGREDHPLFQGVEMYEPGKAYLLSKGTYRLNHTAWWFLPEWGGYGNATVWRERTGGINLASEPWDDYLDGRVGIAEWSDNGQPGNVLIISLGAYDWFAEPIKGGYPVNAYLENIRKLTKNAIDYLKSGE